MRDLVGDPKSQYSGGEPTLDPDDMEDYEFTPESVINYPDEHKEAVLLNLIKNNLFLAAVADVIQKNDFFRNRVQGDAPGDHAREKNKLMKERERL